jgi:4-amino-4-deoxy-L-arabinose transferase-like glycosyltransferase
MTNGRRGFVIVHLSFVILGFVLRLAPLGRYVTPDEPAWVYRSVRFADALAARNWAAVPSTGHPGVTTMWLGAVGVAVRRWVDPVGSAGDLDWIRRLIWLAPDNGAAFHHLAPFLSYGRVAVALVTALGLLTACRLTARLFGRRVALVATGLLAFEPLLVGHSGLLHADALLATFTLLALLAALNGLKGPHPVRWWALCGVFTGLALLTKIPAIVLAPIVLGTLAAGRLRVVQSGFRAASRSTPVAAHRSQLALSALLLLATMAATLFALYPALWADPLGVARTLGGFVERHVGVVQRPVFFAGRMTYDPGPAFYPSVLALRVSPVVLAGLVVGLVRLRRLPADRRLAFLVLLTFAVLFGAAMSIGAKKHDRYLLPAFPPLALCAALALSAGQGHKSAVAGAKPATWYLTRLFVPALQLLCLLPFAAYPLTYASPLLGGPRVGGRVLSLDWGEGMGAAARWLNRLPEADQLTVAALSVPSFASLFAGRTVPLEQENLADYVVLGPESTSDQAVHAVSVGFLDRAVVLENTAALEPAAYLADHAGPDDLILLDADTPLVRRYAGPGTVLSAASLADESDVAGWLAERLVGREIVWLVAADDASPITAAHLRRQLERAATPVRTAAFASATVTEFITRTSALASPISPYRAAFGGQLILVDGAVPDVGAWPERMVVTLRWRAVGTPSSDYRAVVTLRDGEGRAWSEGNWPVLNGVDFPTSAWVAGEWADATDAMALPPGIPPDGYTVEVGLYDAVSGAGLGAAAPDGSFAGTRVVVGEVSIVPPAVSPDRAELGIPEPLDLRAGPLTLLGLDPPSRQVFSGDRLSLSLYWQADAASAVDYRVRLRLVPAAGGEGPETVAPLSSYPTSRWRAGDRFQSRYDLRILPDLAAGRYGLALNVLTADGRPVWEADRVAAEVEVMPRERSFRLPADIPHALDLTFGNVVHLRGYGLSGIDVAPRETVALTLYWQAEGPADRDYTLFVHLLGPDGLLYGQVDRTPGTGTAPAGSWAAGQVFVDEVDLPMAADAPPGAYRIVVGFYDPAYGHRLPVRDGAGRALPGDQAILPAEITVAGGLP